MAVSNTNWRARLLSARAPLLLAAVTLLAYSNSLTNGFTLDSRQAILNDPRVHALTAENLNNILTHTYWWPYDASGLYRPLTTLSYLENYLFFGENSLGFHLFNLLLHVFNAILVYILAQRWTKYALPAALLWSVHPILTESVTNLVGRADLLAALGTLGAIWFYQRRSSAGVALATTVAIFSKESAVVIPLLLLLLFGRDLRRLAASAIPIAAYLIARQLVLADAMPRSVPFLDNPLIAADFWTAKLTALSVLGRYVWLLLWPARLSADYSYAQIPAAVNWPALATFVAAAVAGRRAFLWAAIAILPAANLLFPIGTIMAERFLYLPAIAFAVCLAALWRWRVGQVAICLILIGFTARTWVRSTDWRDDRTMAESLVRAAPESYKGHKLLAFETHSLPEAERAVAILERAGQDDLETLRLAGRLLADNGRYQRSAELLERCWRIVEAHRDAVYPGAAEVLSTLATDYAALGRLDDAAITLMIGQFTVGDLAFRNRLLQLYRGVDCALVPGPAGPAIDPKYPAVHRHLCAAMQRTGKTAELSAYGCKN